MKTLPLPPRVPWAIPALLAGCLVACVAPQNTRAQPDDRPHGDNAPMIQIISEIGSERATQGNGGKIVSRHGKTHIVWQDATEAGYFNRVRTLDRETGRLSEVVTLNRGKDNHARPNLVMDHQGYLHAIISGHNSPVIHRRSLESNDASAWAEPRTIGGGTYPVPTCGPDGTLYVMMRPSGHDGADLYAKPKDQPWRLRCKLVHRDPELPGYGAFHGGLAVSEDGTLHALVNFYESAALSERRGLHQAIAYMKSPDGGETWTKADGTPVEVPARPEEMDALAQDRATERHEPLPPALFHAGANLTLDEAGRPHVLYYDHRIAPGQLLHATPDEGGRWQRTPIPAETFERAFPGYRPTGIESAQILGHGGTILALVALQPLDEMWDNGLPTRAMRFATDRDKRLVWLVSRDGGRSWQTRPAIEGGDFNSPTAERITGGNQLPADQLPPLAYFDGASRYPEAGELLQNNVYLVVPKPERPSEILHADPSEQSPPPVRAPADIGPYQDAESWAESLPDRFKGHEAFAWPEPEPNLPNVLLIGDSISIQYTPGVRRRLNDLANVFRIPENAQHTRRSLERIEHYLEARDWDAIHFNWGIHDVTRVDSDGRTDPGGSPQVGPEAYRANLQRLVRRLKATRAELIWAATTPVREDYPSHRRNADIEAYNRVAAEIMDRQGIPTNDLHALVQAHPEPLWSDGVHFSESGAERLAQAVVEAILGRLSDALAFRPLLRAEPVKTQPAGREPGAEPAEGMDFAWALPLNNALFPQAVRVAVQPAPDNGAGWSVKTEPAEIEVPHGQGRRVHVRATAEPGQPRYPLPEITLRVEVPRRESTGQPLRRSGRKRLEVLGARPRLTMRRARGKPTLDGALIDPVWQGPPSVPTFGRMDLSRDPSPRTAAWVAYDADALYVAFRCQEPRIDGLRRRAKERDERVYLDDSVEVMLDANGDAQSYFQIVVNADGVIYDGRGVDKSVDLRGVEAKTSVRADRWIAELMIPWQEVGLDGPPPQAGLLLARNRQVSEETEVFQFPISPEGNHQPGFFAELRPDKP